MSGRRPHWSLACISLACLGAVLLGGCATTYGTVAEPTTSPAVELPRAAGANDVVLFNSFTQRLVAYDTRSARVSEESNALNFLQYAFPTHISVFTAGNGNGTGFRVLRVEGNDITTVLDLPDGHGIFPLAADAETLLFLLVDYDETGTETGRSVVSLVGDRLVPVPTATGAVDRAAIAGNMLYYTIYQPATDDYQLLSVPLGVDTIPALMTPGLPEPGLFVHDGAVWTSTSDSLVYGDDSFACAQLCWFYDDFGALLSLYINDEAGASLDVVDTVSGTVRNTFTDVVDFDIEGSTLVVYREGYVDRVELSEGG